MGQCEKCKESFDDHYLTTLSPHYESSKLCGPCFYELQSIFNKVQDTIMETRRNMLFDEYKSWINSEEKPKAKNFLQRFLNL